MFLLSTYALACAPQNETCLVNGLDDSAELLQMNLPTRLEPIISEERRETLRTAMKQPQMQKFLGCIGAENTVDCVKNLVQKGPELVQPVQFALSGSDKRDVLSSIGSPDNLAQIQADMKSALRNGRLSPDREPLMEFFEKANFSAADMAVQTAHATEGWRQNAAAHEYIIDYLPQLARLVADHSLFEGLASAGPKLFDQGNTTNPFEVLEHFPALAERSESAFRRLGILDSKEFESLQQVKDDGFNAKTFIKDLFKWKTPSWKPAAGKAQGYLRVASHHGMKFDPKNKTGFMYTVTAGYKNHFYLSQIRGLKSRAVEYNKVVLRIGCYFKALTGILMGGQFQIDLESNRLSLAWVHPIKQFAITLRHSVAMKENTPTDEKGMIPSYMTTNQLGPGVQYNVVSTDQLMRPPIKAKTVWSDFLNVVDFVSKDRGKDMDGAAFCLFPRVGMDRDAYLGNKMIIMSKWRAAPKSRMGYPDARFRWFVRTPNK